MVRILGRSLLFTVICTLVGPSPIARAQSVLWEIGNFDQSSLEFNAAIDLSNPNFNPTYTVGRSTPTKDWPELQPGSQNKAFGGRAHPYTIVFSLDAPPKGLYRLEISALLYNSRVPELLVEINGKSGLFYFNRKLSYYPGDRQVYSPIYGGDQLEIILPTKALRAGENRLVLTALDDARDGDGDSALTYDALRLTEEPAGKSSPVQKVLVEPTVFYVRKDNQLRELTDVTVTLGQKIGKGKGVLIVNKEAFQIELSTKYDFGQQRFEFAVPEMKGKTSALVTLAVDGKSRQFPGVLEPKRQWTLYVVPNVHLDVGFTDYQPKVAAVHSRNVDHLAEEILHHPEMRLCLDGSWVVQQYFETRKPEAWMRFLDLAHQGKITVPAQYANIHTAYPTLETLIRSADYSQHLHRDYGVPFEYANSTDIPNYGWSYPSILSSLGVKYFAGGANTWRAAILSYGRWNERSPFWWQGPDGAKILMAYARQYLQLTWISGLPPQVTAGRQSFPTFLQAYDSPNYKPDAILIYGTQAENSDLVPGIPAFVNSWNSQFAYPKMVLATFPDYFRYIERNFGSSLETVVGDGGPAWEDGVGTDARSTAIDRSNEHRATSAEKLSTIATFLDPRLSPPRDQLRRIWSDNVLFAEHTWSGAWSYTKPESEQVVGQEFIKRQFALDARETVNDVMERSLANLAYKIQLPSTSLVVFNPLNWTRSELVELDLDTNMGIFEYPSLTPVPLELLRQEPEYSHVRFLARDVPSVGYKCYQVNDLRSHGSSPAGETPLPPSNRLENSFYRIEVDPSNGGVSSLFDKQLNRELVDVRSPYRLNEYLYVAGGDETDTQLVIFRKTLPLAKLAVSSSGPAKIIRVRRTSYGQILTVRTTGLHASLIDTDIMLFDHEKKIEFVNRFRKQPVRNKEAVYFAFPFALETSSFSYEIQNGWVDPSKDLLKGANLEWFAVQHWVKESASGVAIGLVLLDAPLVTIGDIDRGTWPERFEPKSSTIFSYVINNYWDTNYPRIQSGDFTARYVLTSGRDLTPEFLSRLGRASVIPLEMDWLNGFDKFGNPSSILQAVPTSFVRVDTPDVVLENWKVAEDGRGTILRILELAGHAVTAQLNFPLFKLECAWLANAAEEDQEECKVSEHLVEVPLKPHGIVTLRVLASGLGR
jgi:pterin-4a-carbinolamine dehydratase